MKSQYCKTLSILTALCVIGGWWAPQLFGQMVNYQEINVYGWGLAINEAAPVFFDIDQDGYMDMLVGNSVGTLWHYEQASGNEFALMSQDFSQIDVGSQSVPTITDLDQDGLLDLIVGSNGDIRRFEQDDIGSYHFTQVPGKMYDVDIGARWAPAIADLNDDGLLEMIVAESLSNLNYFEQDSIGAGTFSLVEENWLGWSGKTYQSPVFTDLENDGFLDLLVGNGYGSIFHLVQDSLNAMTFHEVTNSFANISVLNNATPQVLDVDHDGLLDLYVGEWYVGIHHYEQDTTGSETYSELPDQILGVRDYGASIGYTIGDIDHDGLIDMLVSAFSDYQESYIQHFEQDQQGSLKFNLINDRFSDINIQNYNHLCLYDINGNDRLDLFVGNIHGNLKRYEQYTADSDSFSLVEEKFNNAMKVNQTPQLDFADIDDDDLLDMIVGEGDGRLYHYEQDAKDSVTFTMQNSNFLGRDFGYYSSPCFTDVDGDSLLDLIVGNISGILFYYEQDSVNANTFTEITAEFGSVAVDKQATPRFADVNNDGKTDLFVSDNGGGITLYLRNDDLDITAPDTPNNLSALVDGNYAKLSWLECRAEDLLLYNIYRSNRNDTGVAEYLSSVGSDSTTFTDTTLTKSGKYYYWVTALDHVGNESGFSLPDSIEIELTGISRYSQTHPREFALFQNYPNPFNPKTVIRYALPIHSEVDLSIYNLLGQKVATLVSSMQAAGTYRMQWDGSKFAAGVYIVRLKTGSGYSQTRKIVMIK